MQFFSFPIVFAFGFYFGTLLFVLRCNMDQRKGALVEAATVLALGLLGFAFLFTCLPRSISISQDGVGWVNLLAWFDRPIWQAVFFTLSYLFAGLVLIVGWRISEQLLRGEPVLLASLFRLTTAVGLFAFIIAQADEVWMIPIAASFAIYWLAETASNSPRSYRTRRQALAYTASFLLIVVLKVAAGVSVLEMIGADTGTSLAFGFHGLALVAGIQAAPTAWPTILRRSTRLHRVFWKLAALRLVVGDPESQIHHRPLAALWNFPARTTFLNHGSFGAVPFVIRDWQNQLRRECSDQPMEFLARRYENLHREHLFWLATRLGTQPQNIAFCENATSGMNEIAASFPLEPGDEVLLNDHEYGAVFRIWRRKCDEERSQIVTAQLPFDLNSPQQIVDAVMERVSPRTKIAILSHITSPTAIRLPIEQLIGELHSRGIAVCIDGPHAVYQERIQLQKLDCDFYTASCHKWLCAPIGSGFLYVAPKWQELVRPTRLSWGRLPPEVPQEWNDAYVWTGTKDYSPVLSINRAFEFLDEFERERVDMRNHALACYARQKICQIPGTVPVTPEGREWFGWLVGVWLPDYEGKPELKSCYAKLQAVLAESYGIEVPIVKLGDRYLVRVSCHLYVTTHEVDFLAKCIQHEIYRAN
jgi:isopenicillin-N epimerase